MRVTPLRAFTIGIAAGLLILGVAVFVGARADFHRDPVYAGTPVTPPKFAADAVLTDENGHAAHLFEPDVPVTFLFFGYTHCPDECPLALSSLGRAYRTLPPAERAKMRIVFVTVDPERDSTAALKRYVHIFDPHFIGLTGALSKLEPVYSAYRVWREAVPFKHGPDDYSMAHSTAVYYIDYRGQIRALGNWDDDLQLVVHDLKESS